MLHLEAVAIAHLDEVYILRTALVSVVSCNCLSWLLEEGVHSITTKTCIILCLKKRRTRLSMWTAWVSVAYSRISQDHVHKHALTI